MNEETIENSSTIVISEDVMEKIAKTATQEVEGVATVTTSLTNDIIDKISKKNHNRGVHIVTENNNVEITVSIVVYYDYNIKEIAATIQTKVADAIESMTGYKCNVVNINVIGIESNDAPAIKLGE